MRIMTFLFSIWVGLITAATTTTTQAQVVPFYLEGSFVGNLVTLEATGQAVGLHLGRCSFVVSNDLSSGLTFDTYTAADGSTLKLVRVDLEFEIIPDPEGTGLFYLMGKDFWQIIGGTGRFATAASAGDPIVSTFFTPEPVDLSNPTAIPALYFKEGEMDLGRGN